MLSERLPVKKEASDMFFCLFYSATSLCSFFSGKKREILDDVILMEVGGDVHYISFSRLPTYDFIWKPRICMWKALYIFYNNKKTVQIIM